MENKNVISVEELEKDLATKEAIKNQIDAAFQQVLGQITCLKALIKKAKGEQENKEQKE